MDEVKHIRPVDEIGSDSKGPGCRGGYRVLGTGVWVVVEDHRVW